MLRFYKRVIDKYDVISFDIFDTLIERDVLIASDVFEKISAYSSNRKDSKIFRYERMHAEEEARLAKNDEEITIYDIYSKFGDENKESHVAEEEVNFEIEHCRAKRIGLELYNYALKKRKRIIFVSDMYLDSESIKKILKNCSISCVEHIYISSEIGLSKKDGLIYKNVLEDIKCSNKQLLHIGDNIIMDYFSAKSVGINSIWIPRKKLFISKIKAFWIKISYNHYKKIIKGM